MSALRDKMAGPEPKDKLVHVPLFFFFTFPYFCSGFFCHRHVEKKPEVGLSGQEASWKEGLYLVPPEDKTKEK